MAASRSNRMIALGAAVLVVGMGLATLALRSADASPDADTSAAPAAPTDQDQQARAADEPADPALEPAVRTPESLEVPEGTEAVALQVSFDAGVAAYPEPGDHVNVYGIFTRGVPGEGVDAEDGNVPPSVHRVLTEVEVLSVVGADPVENAGSPTYVLALPPDDVERAVFLQNIERVWLTEVGDDLVPGPTAGADHVSILR